MLFAVYPRVYAGTIAYGGLRDRACTLSPRVRGNHASRLRRLGPSWVYPGVYAGTVPVLRNPCPLPFRVQEFHPYGPMPCLGRKLASCPLVLGVSARPGALLAKTLLRFTGAVQFTMHLGLTVP